MVYVLAVSRDPPKVLKNVNIFGILNANATKIPCCDNVKRVTERLQNYSVKVPPLGIFLSIKLTKGHRWGSESS